MIQTRTVLYGGKEAWCMAGARSVIDLSGEYKKKAPVILHGTSSFYTDTIKENGFGREPVYRRICRLILPEIQKAFGRMNAKSPSEDGELLNSGITAYILSSPGGVYVTNNIVTSLDYSCGTSGGFGEMLYETLAYYTAFYRLYGSYPELSCDEHERFVKQFVDEDSGRVKIKCSPVVYVLRNLPVSSLRHKDGSLINFTTKLTSFISNEQHQRLKENLPYMDTTSYPLKDYLTKWTPSVQIYKGDPIPYDSITEVTVKGELPFFYFSDSEETRLEKERSLRSLRTLMAEKLAELLL